MRARFLNGINGDAFWNGTLEELSNQGVGVTHSRALFVEHYRKRKSFSEWFSTTWSLYFWYSIRVLLYPGKAEFYTITTNPFFLPAFLRLRLGAQKHSIFLVYDLYPDALELAQAVHKGSFVSKIIGGLTSYAVRNCSATVFLGESLKKHAESRFGKSKHSVVIPVGADARPFTNHLPRCLEPTEKILIGYCGNLGRAHDSMTLLELLSGELLGNFDWRFHSFGYSYQSFKLQISNSQNLNSVSLEGSLSDQAWTELMRKMHIAIVTIDSGWENVVMPSKTYSAMAAGQAIIAICAEQCDLAELIRKHDCGWVVPVGDVVRLRQILTTEASDPNILFKKRQNAFEAGQNLYNCSAIAKQWKQLFEALDTNSIPRP